MSRRHAARRRQRGAQLDATRRTRIFSRWAEQPFRRTWWVGQDLHPQRPLYRMRARERMRRVPTLIVRLSVDLSGLRAAAERATMALDRFAGVASAVTGQLRQAGARLRTEDTARKHDTFMWVPSPETVRERKRLALVTVVDAPAAITAVEQRGGRPSTYRYVADRLAEGMSLERALEYLDAGVPDEMARVWNNLRS
jgi:hypothetical protein